MADLLLLVGMNPGKRSPGKIKHAEYLASPHWKARRELAFTKRGRRCQACGSDRNLQVHHASYKRLGAEADRDLYVVCSDCHERIHAFKRSTKISLIKATKMVVRGQV